MKNPNQESSVMPRTVLADWQAALPEVEAESLELLWQQTAPQQVRPRPDPQRLNEVWANIEANTLPKILPLNAGVSNAPVPAQSNLRFWAYGVAAAVALLLGWGLFLRPNDPLPPQEIVVQMAEEREVRLTDGSIAYVNSASKLSIEPNYGEKVRAVRLEGEAFFEVEKGEKPFVVKTFNAEVKVLGTKFNVRARADNGTAETEVFLAEGKVALKGGAEVVMLAPGQRSVVKGLETPVLEVPSAHHTSDALAWRAGRFDFNDESLGEMTQEIGRRFGVVIKLSPDLAQRHHTLLLQNRKEVTSVLEDLCLSTGLRYRAIHGGYEIFKP